MNSTDTAEPIGLIAGGGDLPLLEAQGMRAAGRRVVCVGLAGQFEPELEQHCDAFAVAAPLRLNRWARLLRRWGAREAVMIGTVSKSGIVYDPLRAFRQLPDWRAAKIWYGTLRHDKRSQTLLRAVADELQTAGVTLIDTKTYIPGHLADAGVMTSREPTAAQRKDIDFGWPILMRMNDLQVGQAVAVREQDVLAVEAIEGTDAMIARAGELAHGRPWVLLKAAGPDKDPRFDVPTIGVATIEKLKAAGATCVAVASEKVILADKPKVIEAANAAGIALVGLEV